MSEWIPLDGNKMHPLPKERQVVLVTYRTLKGRLYVRDCECSYAGTTPYVAYFSKKVNGEVIAWMPLPEPYGKEKE